MFSIVKYSKEAGTSRAEMAAAASDAVRQSQRSGSTSPTLDLTASLPTFHMRLEDGQCVSYAHLLQPSAFRRRFLDSQLSCSSNNSNGGGGGGSATFSGVKRFISVDEYSQLAATGSAGAAQNGSALLLTVAESNPLAAYHPHLLDNPELVCGKHRTVLNFSSFTTSLLSYVRPSDLKRDLNQQFRERFPQVQLTLSKLRSLKAAALRVSRKASLDPWSVAQAYVYFEKLALKGFVNKLNRRHCCAVALVLSAKLNDIKVPELAVLLQELETAFRLSKRDILSQEMPALVGLEFSLAVPDYEVLCHQQRLLTD